MTQDQASFSIREKVEITTPPFHFFLTILNFSCSQSLSKSTTQKWSSIYEVLETGKNQLRRK